MNKKNIDSSIKKRGATIASEKQSPEIRRGIGKLHEQFGDIIDWGTVSRNVAEKVALMLDRGDDDEYVMCYVVRSIIGDRDEPLVDDSDGKLVELLAELQEHYQIFKNTKKILDSEIRVKYSKQKGYDRNSDLQYLADYGEDYNICSNELQKIIEVGMAVSKSGQHMSIEDIMTLSQELSTFRLSGYFVTQFFTLFNAAELISLIHTDIDIKTVRELLKVLINKNYHISFDQLSQIASYIDVSDIPSIFNNLTLSEILELTELGVSLLGASVIKKSLSLHLYSLDIDQVIEETETLGSEEYEKLYENNKMKQHNYDTGEMDSIKYWSAISSALEVFNLNDLKKLIKSGVGFAHGVDIKKTWLSDGDGLVVDDVISYCRAFSFFIDSGNLLTWADLRDVLKDFSLEEVKEMLGKNIFLFDIVARRRRIEEQFGYGVRYGGVQHRRHIPFDTFIELISSRVSIKDIKKAILAGFSIDEILRFPFLVSKLLDVRS